MSEQVALDYLHKQVEAEMIGDHRGLNRLPYILFPRVAKLMVDFAREALAAERTAREADLQDVIDWLGTDKPAALAFSSGPKRRIADEIEGLRMNLAAAQAQAAAMRAALSAMLDLHDTDGPLETIEYGPGGTTEEEFALKVIEATKAEAQAALSPDAGRGWLSPEEAERQQAELQAVLSDLRESRDNCGALLQTVAAKDAEIERLTRERECIDSIDEALGGDDA